MLLPVLFLLFLCNSMQEKQLSLGEKDLSYYPFSLMIRFSAADRMDGFLVWMNSSLSGMLGIEQK